MTPKERAEILLHNNYVNPIVIEKIKELFEEQAKEIILECYKASECDCPYCNGFAGADRTSCLWYKLEKKYGVKDIS